MRQKCIIMQDPEDRQWYLVLLDDNNQSYDSDGPYETEGQAREVAEATNLEPIGTIGNTMK